MNDAEPDELSGYRHAINGRLAFATIESLGRLTATISDTRLELAALRADTQELRTWVIGAVKPDGTVTPGLLRGLAELQHAKAWLLGALYSISLGVLINVTLNILEHFKVPVVVH